MGSRGNKQCVEEFSIAVQRFLTGDERERDLVLTRAGGARRQNQVFAIGRERRVRATNANVRDAIARRGEVEDDAMRRVEGEAQNCTTLHAALDEGWDGEDQVVSKFGDDLGSFASQFFRNPPCGRLNAGLVCRSGSQSRGRQ